VVKIQIILGFILFTDIRQWAIHMIRVSIVTKRFGNKCPLVWPGFLNATPIVDTKGLGGGKAEGQEADR